MDISDREDIEKVEIIGLLVVLGIVAIVVKAIVGASQPADAVAAAAPAGCLSRLFTSCLFWVIVFTLVAVVAGVAFFDAVIPTIYAP